nr:Asp23/Gls24 family envelope stress response protein [Rhodococcus erythropolis]
MAEPTTPNAADDPGLRGSLVIKDRAMAKIATAAAVNVPGVVRQSGGLTRLTGRDLPRADISMGSDAVAINLFLAVSWPCSVTELTGRVRAEVGRSVESLTGLPLHDMNVMIAATEGSDESCVSGVEIAEGPAQEALSDPIPPRVPSANPAAAVSASSSRAVYSHSLSWSRANGSSTAEPSIRRPGSETPWSGRRVCTGNRGCCRSRSLPSSRALS